MFTNVNITCTISHILNVIFEEPEKFLKQEKDSKGYLLPRPTMAEFKQFLLSVLKKKIF